MLAGSEGSRTEGPQPVIIDATTRNTARTMVSQRLARLAGSVKLCAAMGDERALELLLPPAGFEIDEVDLWWLPADRLRVDPLRG